MPAHIDEAKNILHVNTVVLYASIENVALIADIPNLLQKLKDLAHVSMVRVFHVSEL